MNVQKRQRKNLMSEINVVPYIDVMLVLLVIFMITAPLLTEGVKVNLPQASAKTLDTKEQEPIVISVDQAGRYFINAATNTNTPIEAEELAQTVASKLTEAKQAGLIRQVLIKGDRDVNYGKVIAAMVLLQQAGVENVGLITETPNTQEGSLKTI